MLKTLEIRDSRLCITSHMLISKIVNHMCCVMLPCCKEGSARKEIFFRSFHDCYLATSDVSKKTQDQKWRRNLRWNNIHYCFYLILVLVLRSTWKSWVLMSTMERELKVLFNFADHRTSWWCTGRRGRGLVPGTNAKGEGSPGKGPGEGSPSGQCHGNGRRGLLILHSLFTCFLRTLNQIG